MPTNEERPTRLCIVTPTHVRAQIGGAQYQIEQLMRPLTNDPAYEIDYIARRVPGHSYTPQGYRLHSIGRGPRMPKISFLVDAIPLYKKLRAIDPEVIYQRVGCGYTAICAYFARKNGARMIWHVAHDADVTPGEHPGDGNSLRLALENWAIEYGLRHATDIVTQTEYQAELLHRHYGRTAACVIPNFHPTPEETIDKTGPLTVAWVANLKPWKRPDAFVRLAKSLADLRSVRFVMAGGAARLGGRGPDKLAQSIETTDNLEFRGAVTQEEVNSLLAGAHLFVNTSQAEGFANTFIQAWMRRVPVVSLEVNPDSVFDREHVGYHAGTEENLSQIVRGLLTDRQRLDEMGAAAEAYALRNHSVANINRLRQIIDQRRP